MSKYAFDVCVQSDLIVAKYWYNILLYVYENVCTCVKRGHTYAQC